MSAAIVRHSEALAAQTVHQPDQTDAADRRLDRILAGKWGIPVMLLLLGLVLAHHCGGKLSLGMALRRLFPFTGLALCCWKPYIRPTGCTVC